MSLKIPVVLLFAILAAACGNDAEKGAQVPVRATAATGDYDATLSEGIQFGDRPGYPRFVSSVTGMSGYEPGNRWTEGPAAIFHFAQPLPTKFILKLEMVGAFGPNAGKPVVVKIGNWQGEFTVDTKPVTIELPVETTATAQAIEFVVPEPASPRDLGVGDDTRKVGVGFKRLSIAAP